MLASDQYQLLDFGSGRKLERFGAYVLDRLAPAADHARPTNPAAWPTATARYRRTTPDMGVWQPRAELPEAWSVSTSSFVMELRPTPFGHIGIFPEQADNWEWITQRIRRAGRPLRVLNLFAYTGGSTLAAAAAGASVVHVDAAMNTVAWARRNAELSGLAEAPIRWIVEDAHKFAARELRRGNHYDAVILDPPTYGHGPKGEEWKIARDLPRLLQLCAQLTEGHRSFILLTCHSPGFEPPEVEALLADCVFGSCQFGATARSLSIVCVDGRQLPSGVVARWPK